VALVRGPKTWRTLNGPGQAFGSGLPDPSLCGVGLGQLWCRGNHATLSDTPFPRWPSFGSSFHCDTLPSVYQHPEMPSEVEMSNSSQSSSEPTILLAYKQGSLAIPAISAECERVFSSTKKLLAPERSRPAPDIIEASECLKT
jgi:hypothetical protein